MFRNEYTMNRNLIKEYVFKILGKKMIIIGTFIFILGMIIFIFDTGSMRYMMFAIAIIGLLCSFLAPLFMINSLEKAGKRLNNGKQEKTVIDFKDKIIMKEGVLKLEFEYNQIKKVKYTKSFIVLRLDKDASILVYRFGFTKGTEDKFIEFLIEQM